jgi:hypothetical protein
MSNEEKLCEIISDHADGLEALAVKLKREIAELVRRKDSTSRPGPLTDIPADTGEIVFTRLVGQKGEYEKSEDFENPRFKALKTTVQAHNGAMTADGFFLWIFPDGKAIGRKRLD